MIAELHEKEIFQIDELNDHLDKSDSYKRSRPFHCTILVQNETGLKNLYKLISHAHIDYFYRVPRIPRFLLTKLRNGLLVGSGCAEGEIFDALLSKSVDEVEELAHYYDFLEVHPPEVYAPLIEREVIQTEAQILDVIRNVIMLGERTSIPVVATGNVHYIEHYEKQYREILIASQKGNPLNRVTLPNTPFRTTNEMLDAFSFLGEKKATEIVIHNSNMIARKIDHVAPVKSDLYTPNIEGSDEEVRELTFQKAREIYGEELPEIVETR